MVNFAMHRFAVFLAVSTLFLIVAGASVTSNEAGLSVPDWPLSYGQVMPEMKGGVFYEHGHRMIASIVGFLTVVLAIWMWRSEERPWLRRIGFIAVGAVILQGVLGGITVLYLLPKAVSISHACLAQLFFSTTVALALFTSPAWRTGPQYVQDSGFPSLRSLAIFASLATVAQVALGAGFRHRAFGILPHIFGAIVVTVVLLTVATFVLTQFPKHRALSKSAWAVIGVTGAQVALGVIAYVSRLNHWDSAPTSVLIASTVTHVAFGALTLASVVALTVEVFYHVRPRAEVASGLSPVSR
ncbi:MAG TPA: COX15/CtaA family protein [Bryobacteraceae bacterium]|nr:COX15/CtaA family protein [Bryobacteraceae bacterium]